MARFDEQRKLLQQARAEAAGARVRAAADRERLERLRAKERELRRSFNPKDPRQVEQRKSLEKAIAAAAETAKKSAALRDETAGVVIGAVADFGKATDPAESIKEWKDEVPILMFPVRLETRFRTYEDRPQLWVRIYPDDCTIDTFEETLSENEVESAKAYWAATWAAGGIESERRGAWRVLAGGHGAGRAEWIIRNYQPLNAGDAPSKPSAQDVVLVIVTEEPLAEPERTALLSYWVALWRAGDDASRASAAYDDLVSVVGKERAAAFVRQYVPFNIGVKPVPPATRDSVNVAAALLEVPRPEDLDVKRRSWSRAATAELLPDRFVFIAFRGGSQEIFQVGEPVISPLQVAPDPSAPPERQIRQDETTGELIFPDELLWMTDFERAIAAGMGFRIDLTVDQADVGLERVLVLGLRFSADEMTAQQELETLLEHHRFSRGGLAIVPQGTPTNNTDDGNSGHSRDEDPDESFDDLDAGSLFPATGVWAEKRDGQWVAEYLGIDPSVLGRVRNSGGVDQSDARAMNAALWPATLGYWMDSMMGPVFTGDAIERTRSFFIRSVLGRGAIPALRIGNQPYGILPATAFSRMAWMQSSPDAPGSDYLRNLYDVLRIMNDDWATMTQYVAHAGKPGDAHQLLLDIVGLHSGSVEFSQRYAESLEQLFNRLQLEGLGGFISALIVAALRQRAMDLLARFGSTPSPDPEMVRKMFLRAHNPLKGPLIDDRPLSEAEAVRAYTPGGMNYLQWLVDAARRSLDAVYAQEGFLEDKPPQALLYLMLRHALQLGFHETGVRLYRDSGLMTPAEAVLAKRDDSFIHVRQQAPPQESRYGLLYAQQAVITGDPQLTVGEFIATQAPSLAAARALEEQIRAIERLQGASTARLERAFAEHVDCCTYRLDAWLLGLVQEQLARMRGLADSEKPTEPRRGIYLGAYSWIEDLRPDRRELVPPVIEDPDVAKDFEDKYAEPLLSDSANQGYIHAPSLNHAVAAAVLRNGYITNAGTANAQTLAVNLTSERVRTALGILEGIRGGQSLGALLGYQFERGLHDRYTFGVELDQFIYDLRREFPLRSNRLSSTRVDDDDLEIQAIEARNVIDGLALVNHMRATGNTAYKFGKSRLPNATTAQAAAINAEAARLVETHDAVADLALAEGVYQAVLGNYDRVASTLDAYGKGNFPPEPQIVRTPFEGAGITHRVALHFEAGLDATVSPVPGIDPTPRALAEPAVNRWLASILPPLDAAGCVVSYRDAAAGVPLTRNVTLQDLALQPADLLSLLREDRDESSLTELDERITRLVAADARPDLPVEIRYMERGTADFSLFEVTPLVRSARRLLQGARPLQPTDLTLSNEAKRADDGSVSIDRQRIVLVREEIDELIAGLGAFIAGLEPLVSDLPNRRGDVLAGVDDFADDLVDLLARAATFAIPQSGWGFVYDFRAAVFSGVVTKARDLINAWTVRLGRYDALLVQYDALPGTATNEEKFRLLMKAETTISTTTVNPVPADPDDYRDALNAKRALFAAKRDEFLPVRDTTQSEVAPLLSDAAAPLPIDEFEFPATSFVDEENAALRFAEDALRVAQVIEREAKRRRDAAIAGIAEHDAAASPASRVAALTAAAKALLGEDFTIVPELVLAPDRAAEVASASAASASLLDYLVSTVDMPEPVDTWLYGVARVRERMHHWEQVVMLAGAFDRPEPELTPLQLPFLVDDRWLALEFPPDADLQTDRLLYTAHFAASFAAAAPQCGLLLDEWTEVIPSDRTTTGLAFHYDRPNNEAPQAMLLVTPAAHRGAWQWEDLIDALNETLDLAKRRAVEPVHVDNSAYAQFLPATVMAVTISQLTISMNLALNNDLAQWVTADE